MTYHDYPCTKSTSMAACARTPGQITTSDTYTDLQYNWENACPGGRRTPSWAKVIPTGISEINSGSRHGQSSGTGPATAPSSEPVDHDRLGQHRRSGYPVRQHLHGDGLRELRRPRYVLGLRALRAEGSVQRERRRKSRSMAVPLPSAASTSTSTSTSYDEHELRASTPPTTTASPPPPTALTSPPPPAAHPPLPGGDITASTDGGDITASTDGGDITASTDGGDEAAGHHHDDDHHGRPRPLERRYAGRIDPP